MGECFMLNRAMGNTLPKYSFKDKNGTDRTNNTSYIQFISDGGKNWRIKFKQSGTFTLQSAGNARILDVFLVGGGASPGGNAWSKAGGGGYTKTYKEIRIGANRSFSVTVGAGGAATSNDTGNDGEASKFVVGSTTYQANGGNKNGNGGSGGGKVHPDGGGKGGSDGSDGEKGYNDAAGGTGQHTTTREFGESNGTLYAGGGGGCSGLYGYAGGDGGGGAGSSGNSPVAGTANTGGGGGHRYGSGGAAGGSGIVVIRNHR